MQVERLGSFSAERQMQARVTHFLNDPSLTLLLLQADSCEDGDVIAHAKYVLDEACAEYLGRGGREEAGDSMGETTKVGGRFHVPFIWCGACWW